MLGKRFLPFVQSGRFEQRSPDSDEGWWPFAQTGEFLRSSLFVADADACRSLARQLRACL